MGRAPCCDKANVKRGPWSPEEDLKLKEYIEKHGTGGNWIALPQKAGLKRCGKSCRLRWLNYLRPNIKHGEFSEEEDRIICSLYVNIGSRWSIIAAQLPGRTDNDIKNYWNTKLKKKLMGLLPPPASSSHNHHQRVIKPPFPSSNQNPPPPSPSSSMYIDYFGSYYTTPETITTSTFTCLDPNNISLPPPSDHHYAMSTNSTTTTSSISHPFYQSYQDSMVISGGGGAISPMQMQYNYNNHPIRDHSMFVFGSEGSCSSSDGSCSQVSHGRREIKQEEMGGYNQSCYMSSTFDEHNSDKFLVGYNSIINDCGENIINNQWTTEKCFGQISQTQIPLDYDLEDIKQLISVSSSSNFNIDEIKGSEEEEKAMYYYYF